MDLVLVTTEGGGTIGSDGTNDDGGGRRIRMTMVAGLGSPGFYFYFYFFSPNLFLYAAGIGNRVKKMEFWHAVGHMKKIYFRRPFGWLGWPYAKIAFDRL